MSLNKAKNNEKERANRRRFIGLALGASVGAAAMIIPNRASAFSLSPTEIFKLFLKNVGTILVMFFARRFYQNWVTKVEDFLEKTKINTNNDAVQKTQSTIAISEQYLDQKNKQDNDISARQMEIGCNAIQDAEINELNHKASQIASFGANELNTYYQEDVESPHAEGTANKPFVVARQEELQKHLTAFGKLSLTQLPKLFEETAFTDIERANEEMKLCLKDCKITRDTKNINHKAMEASLASSVSLATKALSYAFARRVPSKELADNLKDSIDSDYFGSFRLYEKMAEVESIGAEVDYFSLSEAPLSNNNNFAAATPACYVLSQQLTLKNTMQLKINQMTETNASMDSAIAILIAMNAEINA